MRSALAPPCSPAPRCWPAAVTRSRTEEATVETYVTVPPAQVVSGLAGTQQLMDALVAAPATADQSTVDAVNNSWLIYEGNIRLDDAASYLAAEDALALFSKAALAGRRRRHEGRRREVPHTRRDVHRRPPELRSAVVRRTPRAAGGDRRRHRARPAAPPRPPGLSARKRSASSTARRRSIDETLALIKAGHAEQALAAGPVAATCRHFELVEIPLRVVDNDADGQGRVPVRRDPQADPRRRAGRRDPRRDRRAARPARRRRAQAHRRRRRRAGAGRRPVVPHHLPRGLRGRAAAVGAARLPRGGASSPQYIAPDPRAASALAARRHRASPCC